MGQIDSHYCKFNHSFFLSMIGTITLVLYLISAVYLSLPSYLFWILIIAIPFIIVWQIGIIDSTFQEWLVLFEIVVFGIVLHLIFVLTVPYGVFGRDVFNDLSAMKLIADFGWPISNPLNITDRTLNCLGWPLLHILGIIFSDLLGIEFFSVENPFTVLKIMPTVISTFFPLCFFIVVQKLYANTATNLLATLGATTIYYNVQFHSLFVRETIAYVILFVFLYCLIYYCICSNKNRFIMAILMILLLFALTFAHFLTFFFLLLFLVIITANIFFYQNCWPGVLGASEHGIKKYNYTVIILLISLLILVVDLIYINKMEFNSFVLLLNSFFDPVVYTSSKITSERSVKNYLILIMRVAITLIFLIFIFIQSIKRERTFVWDVLGLQIGIISFLLIFINWVNKTSFIEIPRIEGFAWPFILISGCWSLSKAKSVLHYILVLFVFYNCLLFPSYLIDPNADSSDSLAMSYKYADYKIVEWFDGNDGLVMGDITVDELLGGLSQFEVKTDTDIYYGKFDKISKFDYLVIRKENFNIIGIRGTPSTQYKLSLENYHKLDNSPLINKIYNNPENIIFGLC